MIRPEILEAVGEEWAGWAEKLVGAGLLLLSTAVNLWSTSGAATVQVTAATAATGKQCSVQVVVTVAKLCGVGVVLVGGLVMLGQGHTEHFSTGGRTLKHLLTDTTAEIKDVYLFA